MKRKGTSELLRDARPQLARWASSSRGRTILTRVLDPAVGSQLDQPGDDLDPRRTSRRRIGVAIVAVAALATAALLIAPRFLDQLSIGPAGVGAIDVHVKSDLEFFAPMRLAGGAIEEVHNFETVDDGVKASTAVVVAKVVDVKKTRMIHDVHMWGMTIQPVEILSGKLPEQDRDKLTVEFLAGSVDPADSVARMKEDLPKGLAVWFLISKADASYYVLSSSQGLYLQGKDHVVNPIAAPGSGGMVTELESRSRLSEVAETVRALR
ncbi:hypothetical protein [Tenggerimyces flavus]|uniref:Uncharacterized protein n=1 Tax=Tenggerimyces flavus TaxID=1708749 RepID=A0ABV7Y7V9_9ACTN|nr:hypothetical protein [Tenggerimyces flavus]MBM7785603.1 hypothetical protein [Tenggerimyces flavus]